MFEQAGVDIVFRVIDLMGVFFNGILGARIARKEGFDIVGFIILALVSAMGGGVLRDMVLNQVPVAFTDSYYIATALVGALFAFLWKFQSKLSYSLLILVDGVALGCWAATGVSKALIAGFGPLQALILGIVTAVGGGMIRDICVRTVPRIFGGNNLYATPAFISAVVMLSIYHLGHYTAGMITATIVGALITGLANWRHWTLPRNTDWSLRIHIPRLLRRLMRHWKK